MALLVDKKTMPGVLYGAHRRRDRQLHNNPAALSRRRTRKWEFNIDKANALLDDAGWKKGADGIRDKGGKKMKVVYQTSINGTRQKEQAIVKEARRRPASTWS